MNCHSCLFNANKTKKPIINCALKSYICIFSNRFSYIFDRKTFFCRKCDTIHSLESFDDYVDGNIRHFYKFKLLDNDYKCDFYIEHKSHHILINQLKEGRQSIKSRKELMNFLLFNPLISILKDLRDSEVVMNLLKLHLEEEDEFKKMDLSIDKLYQSLLDKAIKVIPKIQERLYSYENLNLKILLSVILYEVQVYVFRELDLKYLLPYENRPIPQDFLTSILGITSSSLRNYRKKFGLSSQDVIQNH